MSQISIPYAVARAKTLEKDALDAGKLDRLINAGTLSEAKRTLAEIGWTNAETVDYERLADQHVEKACRLINQITPDPELTNCFLLTYDVQNLKMLLKARCLGEKAEYLSSCGTISVELLKHAVTDHNYHKLPSHLAQAMDQLEKSIVVDINPMMIDVTLDQAMYAQILETVRKKKSKGLLAYFQAKIDILNCTMLLRAKDMGRKEGFFEQVFLKGGTIDLEKFKKAFDEPERLPKLLAVYGKEVAQAAQDAVHSARSLPALEKTMDNLLMKRFSDYKFELFTIEPLYAYILSVQREAAAVRLIMSGKANGFTQEDIRERMRDLHA